MPSIIEVDTIKNKTGTQNTVLSTDGSGNNTLNAGVIKSNTGSNTGLTIASDGQVTISQNNPTVTLGTNTTFPAGHVLQTKIKQFGTVTTISADSGQTIYDGDSDSALQMSALGVNSFYLMGIHCTMVGIQDNPTTPVADDSDLGVRVQYKKGDGSYTEYPSTQSHSHRFSTATHWNTNVNFFSTDGFVTRLPDNAWGAPPFSHTNGEVITSAIGDVLKWKVQVWAAVCQINWNRSHANATTHIGHTAIVLQEIKQ